MASYQDVLPSWFQAYVGLEESAESIRSYDAQFIPGLLQTEDYATAVIALGDFSLEETERLVYLRKERQRRFSSGGLRLWAIIDEVCAAAPGGRQHQPDAGPARASARCSDMPGFTLQVAPLPAGAYAAPGSFSILRFAVPELPDVVYLEQLTSAMYLDKPSDVDRYVDCHGQAQCRQRAARTIPADHPRIARGYGGVPMSSIRNGMTATALTGARWSKSSRSGPTGGNCVEIACAGRRRVAMRNSRDPDGPALIFTRDEWEAFRGGVVAGEFDGPPRPEHLIGKHPGRATASGNPLRRVPGGRRYLCRPAR